MVIAGRSKYEGQRIDVLRNSPIRMPAEKRRRSAEDFLFLFSDEQPRSGGKGIANLCNDRDGKKKIVRALWNHAEGYDFFLSGAIIAFAIPFPERRMAHRKKENNALVRAACGR